LFHMVTLNRLMLAENCPFQPCWGVGTATE